MQGLLTQLLNILVSVFTGKAQELKNPLVQVQTAVDELSRLLRRSAQVERGNLGQDLDDRLGRFPWDSVNALIANLPDNREAEANRLKLGLVEAAGEVRGIADSDELPTAGLEPVRVGLEQAFEQFRELIRAEMSGRTRRRMFWNAILALPLLLGYGAKLYLAETEGLYAQRITVVKPAEVYEFQGTTTIRPRRDFLEKFWPAFSEYYFHQRGGLGDAYPSLVDQDKQGLEIKYVFRNEHASDLLLSDLAMRARLITALPFDWHKLPAIPKLDAETLGSNGLRIANLGSGPALALHYRLVTDEGIVLDTWHSDLLLEDTQQFISDSVIWLPPSFDREPLPRDLIWRGEKTADAMNEEFIFEGRRLAELFAAKISTETLDGLRDSNYLDLSGEPIAPWVRAIYRRQLAGRLEVEYQDLHGRPHQQTIKDLVFEPDPNGLLLVPGPQLEVVQDEAAGLVPDRGGPLGRRIADTVLALVAPVTVSADDSQGAKGVDHFSTQFELALATLETGGSAVEFVHPDILLAPGGHLLAYAHFTELRHGRYQIDFLANGEILDSRTVETLAPPKTEFQADDLEWLKTQFAPEATGE